MKQVWGFPNQAFQGSQSVQHRVLPGGSTVPSLALIAWRGCGLTEEFCLEPVPGHPSASPAPVCSLPGAFAALPCQNRHAQEQHSAPGKGAADGDVSS